jgi:membrane protease subunit (stomatin/prohibitin family)
MAFNLFEVVEYAGDAENFAWRYENPNVKKNTTVVVHANQIAFWVSNGVLVQTLSPGKHKLDGNYVQGLSWIASQFHGGNVPSSGEIWFVSSGYRSIRWGTPQRLQVAVNGPGFTVMAEVAANGNIQMRLNPFSSEMDAERVWRMVNDLNEAYGSNDANNPSVSVNGLARFVQERIVEPLNAGFSDVFKAVELGRQAGQLPGVSEWIMKEYLQPALAQWGFSIESLKIDHVGVDDAAIAAYNDHVAKLNAAEAAKFVEQRTAEAKRYGIEQEGYGVASSRAAQGYTYQETRQFDVLESGAGNAGVGGSFMSAGVGLAMGGAVGGVVGNMFANAASESEASRHVDTHDVPAPATSKIDAANNVTVGQTSTADKDDESQENATKFCLHCGAVIPRLAKFCPECGGAQ